MIIKILKIIMKGLCCDSKHPETEDWFSSIGFLIIGILLIIMIIGALNGATFNN